MELLRATLQIEFGLQDSWPTAKLLGSKSGITLSLSLLAIQFTTTFISALENTRGMTYLVEYVVIDGV